MAEKVTVIRRMTDDLDGQEYDPTEEGAGETLTFGWKGREYAIDLRADNAAEFARLMERYTGAARRVARKASTPERDGGSSRVDGSGRRRGGGQGMGRSKEEIAEIREWLRAHGHKVADSGMIPRKLVEEWEKGQGQTEMPVPAAAASAAARTPGKGPGAGAPAFSGAKPASPLDAVIRPISSPLPPRPPIGADNR